MREDRLHDGRLRDDELHDDELHDDELKVPSQRADDAHDSTRDTSEDGYRDPYAGSEHDRLVATGPVADSRITPTDDPTNDLTDGPATSPGTDPVDDPADRDLSTRTGAGTDPETVIVTERVTEPPVYTTFQETGPDETPSHAAPKEIVLFDQDPTEVQARWRDLQTSFVDDPAEAVHRADDLVEEVVEALTSSLTARTGELREHWKGADGGDTERLRLALRDYRGMLERLLALSETKPSGTQPSGSTASDSTTSGTYASGTR